jgi:hypothetical protein
MFAASEVFKEIEYGSMYSVPRRNLSPHHIFCDINVGDGLRVAYINFVGPEAVSFENGS